jgi:TolB-like protein/tetratricopeptide (TPR) repeat protein
VVAMAVLGVEWRPWRRSASAEPLHASAASVAVLPFKNLAGNPADGYLSDGMTEEVIGQLAQVRVLKVISRTSTEALKDAHLTLRQIAETLGVRHILEGSVRHAGARIRVEVDLIDAATDSHVWVSVYDRDLTDMFAVQEEIARHVADSLGHLIGARPSLAGVARTDNPEAYAAYQTGRYLVYRRTEESLRGALEQFRQAIAQDSSYAPAYAGMATVYLLWAAFNYRGIDPHEALGRALAMADRAIALDSNLAEAYAARGLAQTLGWGPAAGALADFQRALQLRPNAAEVHQWYAQLLSREGRSDDGLLEAERAVALDPLAPGTRDAAALEALGARHYDVAAQHAARALLLEPGLMDARHLQALADLLSGHAERCAGMDLGPFPAERALCVRALGDTLTATRIVDSLRSKGAVGDVLGARGLAEYDAAAGKATESLAWLEQAYTYSPVGEDPQTIASGLYDHVRNDPRFIAGVKRIRAHIFDRVQSARRSFAH